MDSKWTKITYKTIKRLSLYSEDSGKDKKCLKHNYIIIIIWIIINYCVDYRQENMFFSPTMYIT